MQKICWTAFPVLLALAPASYAQSIGYEEALRAAVSEQPQVRARELQLEARRSVADAADELPDPRLRAGIQNLPVAGPAAFEIDRQLPTQIQVGVEQDIPNLAERHARARMAVADIDLASAQLTRAQLTARLGAGEAWISLAYTQQALNVIDEALRQIERLVPLARSAVAAGSARPAESLEIRRAVLEVEDMRTRLEGDLDAARAMLARYAAVQGAVATGAIPAADVDAERLRATLELNPDIILAIAQVRQADARIDLARSEKRPDFGINVSYGRRDPMFGDVVSVMGSITLPIFAGRRQNPRIAAAEAEASAAQAIQLDRLRELQAQFEADLAAWRSAYRQWQRATEELLPLAQSRADLERASFAANRAELLDVIEAIKALALLQIEILEREEATVEAATTLRLTYTEFQP
ncbi:MULTISPECIES: TolC family protein [Sphingomonadales]|jgi:outer membrane protein, heavy metal efflux system|uniref:TolC family protein n=3 Tax=Erythrobacteraceae TaxID=335929 RepID=A0A7G6VTP5_9SPHN|nr:MULTISPECIES: TolC family protein [Sphingomonadales]MAB45309.1 heavy metal RND transporter [Sphingomonadaceae bacterium]MBV02491.1 heavy metal RND transporter [Citromicrobium sp.]MCV0384096.1 TolC family protein [Erythrobacter sp.]MCA0891564.1 TolC family protein [Qipengyuania flava]MXO54510.1 TolC family protein [Qipengyuania pelagi]|tara:strand:+ start:3925 stop:5160 length:1236 start_codon:yes stop_codon:yes gene_type:complete